MAKTRLNTEEAFISIMGKTAPAADEAVAAAANKAEPDKEKLVQTAFYITKKQRAALKIKAATDGTPENKDQSAIVRAALDRYLADTLDGLPF